MAKQIQNPLKHEPANRWETFGVALMGIVGIGLLAYALILSDPTEPVVRCLQVATGMGMLLAYRGFTLDERDRQSRNHNRAVLRQLFPECFPADDQQDAAKQ